MGLFIGSGIFAEPFDEKKYEREYLSGYLLKGITYVSGDVVAIVGSRIPGVVLTAVISVRILALVASIAAMVLPSRRLH